MSELASLAAQFGFPALIAIVMLYMYNQLVQQLTTVIKENTTSAQKIAACLDALGERLERVERCVDTRRT